MRYTRWLMYAGLWLATPGCDDNTPLCIPQTTERCFCYTGDPGQRRCSADGLEYGSCECLPDAGIDATPDAPSDMTTAASTEISTDHASSRT